MDDESPKPKDLTPASEILPTIEPNVVLDPAAESALQAVIDKYPAAFVAALKQKYPSLSKFFIDGSHGPRKLEKVANKKRPAPNGLIPTGDILTDVLKPEHKPLSRIKERLLS